ncbi:MAG: AAA family ATPase [Halioglobus sp.]|nr:AAA family ATPase [Halioglobus sp.]
MPTTEQQLLIEALLNPAVFPEETDTPELIETHISWVILCGGYAYKIKKALDLGFLDFTTLKKRQYYCEEELRLNSRLAPNLYLDVVPITGTQQEPVLAGTGQVLEYAVKMRRFSQDALLAHMAERGLLEQSHIDQVTSQIADFHVNLPAAQADSHYGDPHQVHAPVQENFTQIRNRTDDPQHIAWLGLLERWMSQEYHRCFQQFSLRKQQGYVRECHGDMHLGNMAMIDQMPVIFDGIEFNPDLYWIDVMSEVAFLFMDLEDHNKREYAFRFLNRYLESTGYYSGLCVLRYYLAYRAMVRAKVASIRFEQVVDRSAQSKSLAEFENYMQLALGYTRRKDCLLLITHGLSGSGKSTYSAPLAERMGAIRVRSDRERQRLFGRGKANNEMASIGVGVYSDTATEKTYATLRQLARDILESGYSAIIDATFLGRAERDIFKQLANDLSVPLRILCFTADPEELRRRVEARQREANDISEADRSVLEHQLDTYEELHVDEQSDAVVINTQLACDSDRILALIKRSVATAGYLGAG